MFLGHTIGRGKIRMDQAKIQVILEWELPTKVTELRSFLGLVKYYRRTINNYSAIAAPLTDLLKKNRAWNWNSKSLGGVRGLEERCDRGASSRTTRLQQTI